MNRESLGIRFLYKTIPGRMLLKVFTKPAVSRGVASFLSSFPSRLLIPPFVRRNHIDLSRFEEPVGGYGSFNDFFTRKLKNTEKLPDETALISPCDGLLTIKDISDDMVFEIKNSRYSLSELLAGHIDMTGFKDGMALIFRLTPAHFHRYRYCASGFVMRSGRIEGILHCVRPIAVESYNVYSQNSREYTMINTLKHGKVIQMEVGALLVGKITNFGDEYRYNLVRAGEEKGYFEYGGSTIILLIDQKIKLSNRILEQSATGEEIPVKVGELLEDPGEGN